MNGARSFLSSLLDETLEAVEQVSRESEATPELREYGVTARRRHAAQHPLWRRLPDSR